MENSSKMLHWLGQEASMRLWKRISMAFRRGSGFDRARGSYRLLRGIERG